MKKVYFVMVDYDEELKVVDTIFFKKSDVEIYCKLKNEYNCEKREYYVKEIEIPDLNKDRKNVSVYKSILKDSLKKLNRRINDISGGWERFRIAFNDGYYGYFAMKELEDILTNNNYKDYVVECKNNYDLEGGILFNGNYINERNLTDKDLPAIKKGYEDSKQMIGLMENRLIDYKKTFDKIVGNNEKQNQEEIM